MHTDTRPALLVPAQDARAIHGYLLAHLSDLVSATCDLAETPALRTVTCATPDDWAQIAGLLHQIRQLGLGLSALPAPQVEPMADWLSDLLTGDARLTIRGAAA